MTLYDRDTDDLMHTLQQAEPSDMREYFGTVFARGEPTFSAYVDALLRQKGLKRQDVLIKANLPQKYGYKLLSGESHTTDRDKILRLCLAMELTLKETQRVLKLYGMNELYPKHRRDVVLIVALGQKLYDVDRVNELLRTEGLAPLYEPEEDERFPYDTAAADKFFP